jgi:hypothetical protein
MASTVPKLPPKPYSLSASPGYILLTAAIIISAIALLAAVSVLFFANGFIKNDRALERSNQAKGLANACGETAVQNVIASSTFTGSANLTLGAGSCSYAVTEPSGSTALINATGTVATVLRKLQINMNISPSESVTKWQEVP